MAGISFFPIAEGAIMRVTAAGTQLLIELSPVEMTAITRSLIAANRASSDDHQTLDDLKASLAVTSSTENRSPGG